MVQKREFAEHSRRRKGLARGSFYNAAEDEPPFGTVGHPAPTAGHGGVHNGSKTCQTCYTNKPGGVAASWPWQCGQFAALHRS